MEEFTETEEEERSSLEEMFPRNAANSFNFSPIQRTKVKKIIKNLPSKSSFGDDEISYNEIKDAAYYLIDPLLLIINTIITTGHWPSQWKNSIIKPLLKPGLDKMEPSSYRPIALTNALSRLAEKILNEQLSDYISQQKWIPEESHGFVKGRSCTTACIQILQELADGVEDGFVPSLLGVDISGAFDCIQRNKLLSQMKSIGSSDDVISLFSSYFSSRTQQVEIGGRKSKKKPAP